MRTDAKGAAPLMRQTDFTFGCPVAPMILDAAGDVVALEALCKATLADWQTLMRDAFTKTGIAPGRGPRPWH